MLPDRDAGVAKLETLSYDNPNEASEHATTAPFLRITNPI